MTLREFLASALREDCPDWLMGLNPNEPAHPAETLQRFMRSRLVYYPGSGFDGDPVAAFNASRAAHCFVYVDYLTGREALLEELRERGFRGYRSIKTIDLQEADFRIGAWTRHIREPVEYHFPPVPPYGFLEIFERLPSRGEDHGAQRFAVLFLAADAHAAYDAMFCQRRSPPPPFCIVLQDHSFGGGYSPFGRGGVMANIARETARFPQLLLVAEDTDAWQGYARCDNGDGAAVDAESQGGRMRALWARDAGTTVDEDTAEWLPQEHR